VVVVTDAAAVVEAGPVKGVLVGVSKNSKMSISESVCGSLAA